VRRPSDLSAPRRGLRFGIHYDPEAFGRFSEGIARFLGTARFLVAQTAIVAVWITLNVFAVNHRWDPYPFILLNLAFSTQAAYAAPLILLAETRQAARDKTAVDMTEQHRERTERAAERRVAALKAETDKLEALLQSNTDLTRQDKELTEQVATLTREIHAVLTKPA